MSTDRNPGLSDTYRKPLTLEVMRDDGDMPWIASYQVIEATDGEK